MTPWRSRRRWKSNTSHWIEPIDLAAVIGAFHNDRMSRTYPVGIVGEASYQTAIRSCAVGQRVRIVHEPDNPYDEFALAVATEDGRTLGYIARDSWLQDAVHEEGKGCEAIIKEISAARRGRLGVVLDVSPSDHGIDTRAFSRVPVENERSPSGCLASLFGL